MDPISNNDPEYIREMADMETGWDDVIRRPLVTEPYLANLRRYPSLGSDVLEYEGFDE